jgi:hypothetical protein
MLSKWSEWAWGLLGGVTLLKLFYLVVLCPYELSGDEAHYWEWSRRLELSYHTKGPGIAWTIAGVRQVLGDSEWAIRLPAVVFSFIAAVSVYRLTLESAHSDLRSGFYAVAMYFLTPAFLLTSLLMTPDAPLMAFWALALWGGWRIIDRLKQGRTARWAWLWVGAAIGVGLLYKHTMLLLPLGMLGFALTHGVKLRPKWRNLPWAIGGLLLAGAAASPMVIWNAQNGWPNIAHLLGHLGVGAGDQSHVQPAGWSWDWRTTPEFLAGQLLILGPVAALIPLALWWTFKPRPERTPEAWTEEGRFTPAYLWWCALPTLGLYLAVSVVTDVEANWPIAAYLSVFCLLGQFATTEMIHFGKLIRRWNSRSADRTVRRGFFRKRPQTVFQLGWHTQIGYGALGCLGLMFLPTVVSVLWFLEPLAPLHRVQGHDQRAYEVSRVIKQVKDLSDQRPFVICSYYDEASLMAYYLDGQPSVACLMHQAGGRLTAYDYFEDTDLDDPERIGRPAILVGKPGRSSAEPRYWQRVLEAPNLEQYRDQPPIFVTLRYGGVRPEPLTRSSDGLTGPSNSESGESAPPLFDQELLPTNDER